MGGCPEHGVRDPAYHEGTAALGYLARRYGFRRTLAVFVPTEVALAYWIGDGLLPKVVMPIYPLDAVEARQTAGHWFRATPRLLHERFI